MRDATTFTATATAGGRLPVLVPVPFDPDDVWGRKREHHVHGTVDGMNVLDRGPQRSDLAADVAAALEAESEAGASFDSLDQFYRQAYLRWIDATKRSPRDQGAPVSRRRSCTEARPRARAGASEVTLPIDGSGHHVVPEHLVDPDHVCVRGGVPGVERSQLWLGVAQPAQHSDLEQEPEPVSSVAA